VITAPAFSQSGADWPMFGFDLAHDGYNRVAAQDGRVHAYGLPIQ
jgi:hypothetical protein